MVAFEPRPRFGPPEQSPGGPNSVRDDSIRRIFAIMDVDRLKAIGWCVGLVFVVVMVVVIVWPERVKRRRHEAFLRWQESEAGKDFRWVDGTDEPSWGGFTEGGA
jgi:hypothetical protein